MPVGGVRLLSVNCYEQIPTWPKVLGRHCKFLMGLVGENRRLSRPGMPSSPKGRRFKSDPRNQRKARDERGSGAFVFLLFAL